MEDCHFPPYPADGRLYCNATYDGVQCWNYTLAGTVAYGSCSQNHRASILFDNPEGYAYRKCETNGQWWNNDNNGTHEFAKSNYLLCVSQETLNLDKPIADLNLERIQLIFYVNISGYAVSILLLMVALTIFGFFKQLHCKRVTIHSHLFVSYILSGSVWIAFYTKMSHEHIEPGTRPVWCYVLHSLALYTTLSNYAWMLGEGIFLHFSLTNVFSERKRLLVVCCVIGWVVPAVIILVYCVTRIVVGENESESCWLKAHPLIWIVFIPIMISLLLNLIFLINILRILLSKLRSVNQRNFEQYKKTVRAILVLVPLLGLQYILMPLKNDSFLYKIVAAIITSYQGALIAVLFCFLNGEVILLIKRKTCHWCSISTRETGKISMKSNSKRIKEYDANDAHAQSEEMEIFVSAHPCVV